MQARESEMADGYTAVNGLIGPSLMSSYLMTTVGDKNQYVIDAKKDAIKVVLVDALSAVGSRHQEWCAEKFVKGRAGRRASEKFEEVIKEFIAIHMSEIIQVSNGMLAKLQFPLALTRIESTANESEADARTLGDLNLIFTDQNSQEDEAVINIKYTNGGTADNIGGWSAFGLSMGFPGLRTRAHVMNHCRVTPYFPDNAHDYYVWTVYKSFEGVELFRHATLVSFLTIKPSSFSFNPSQSFPVQINVRKATHINRAIPPVDRREMLFTWLMDKGIAYGEKKVQGDKEILAARNQAKAQTR